MLRDEHGTLYLEYGPRDHYKLPSYVISDLLDEQQTSDRIGSPTVSSWEMVPRIHNVAVEITNDRRFRNQKTLSFNGYSIAIKAWADVTEYRKLETMYSRIVDPFLEAYVEQIRPPKPVSEIKVSQLVELEISNWRRVNVAYEADYEACEIACSVRQVS